MTNSIDWQAIPIASKDTAVHIAEIMAELGIKSRTTIYRRAKAGKLPMLVNDGGHSFCWRSHLDLYKANLRPIYSPRSGAA